MNEELADLIEQHKTTIATNAYHNSVSSGFNVYVGFSPAEAIGLIEVTLDFITNYLRTNQIDGWRNYITDAAQQLIAAGFRVEQINGAGAIIIEAIVQIVEQESAGPENEKTRLKYLRRLDGLKTLAVVTTIGARYKPVATTEQAQI